MNDQIVFVLILRAVKVNCWEIELGSKRLSVELVFVLELHVKHWRSYRNHELWHIEALFVLICQRNE